MRRLLSICICCMIIYSSKAQDNSGCNMVWGNAAKALYNNEGSVFYYIQFSKCTSSGICGWPKIALEHTFPFPVKIGITLRGLGCDNTTLNSSFSTGGNDIAANNRYVDQGNWHLFKQVTDVVRVEISYKKNGDRYQILYDKDKGINRTTINGKSIADLNNRQNQSALTQHS